MLQTQLPGFQQRSSYSSKVERDVDVHTRSEPQSRLYEGQTPQRSHITTIDSPADELASFLSAPARQDRMVSPISSSRPNSPRDLSLSKDINKRNIDVQAIQERAPTPKISAPSPIVIEQDKLSAALPVKPPLRKQFSTDQRHETSNIVPELALPLPSVSTSQSIDRKQDISTEESASLVPPNKTPLPSSRSEVIEQPPSLVDETYVVASEAPEMTEPLSSIQETKEELNTLGESNQAPSTQSENDAIGDMCLTESLSAHDLTKILSVICNCIENLDEPLIVKKSYYVALNPSSSSNLSKSNVENVIDLAGLDELTPDTAAPEVLTWIILKIAEEKGSYLLPRWISSLSF